MSDHPKFGAPIDWVNLNDPKKQDFLNRWTAVSVAEISSRQQLEGFALKLGKRFYEDTTSGEPWHYRQLEISDEEKEKLTSLYLMNKSFELARNEILEQEVYLSKKYISLKKRKRIKKFFRVIFWILTGVAVLKILSI
jgi:hypothetical protein